MELVDAHLCSDAGKFLAALLLSLSSMMHLELPHVNVLSKADLVEAYGELHFDLDYYTEVRPPSTLGKPGLFWQPCSFSRRTCIACDCRAILLNGRNRPLLKRISA